MFSQLHPLSRDNFKATNPICSPWPNDALVTDMRNKLRTHYTMIDEMLHRTLFFLRG
jgi:hypothetical protein